MGQFLKDDIPRIRMMVLETDEPVPDTLKEKGRLSDILHHHFTKAGEQHDPPLGIETDEIFVITEKGGKVPKSEEFEDIHCVLITGSMHDAHGDNPWILELLDLLRELYLRRPDCTLSGVCFGHQLICRLFGAKLFRICEDVVFLYQMHRNHVVAPPTFDSSDGLLEPGAKVHVWGSSKHTKVQGVFIANRVFTTQAHLAFDEYLVHRQIEARIESGGIRDLEHADKAKETAHWEQMGTWLRPPS
ncbi:GMP synthase [Pseudomassariella vexata]|uniref:GMP synthase n=1 Tax=Pseudomassariella vexata TaxID=1141098 RepID=A0A1Y2E0U4_9PEZI|nr:GMP synthase [Pseudomassariella vexata]ORY64956.1 GMP synthase [Pseudomassariella vexata]